MKATILISALLSTTAAIASPSERLVGVTQRNDACVSGYQIYSPGEYNGKRWVTCLIWSELVSPRLRRMMESSGASAYFFGEQTNEGFIVASVSPIGE